MKRVLITGATGFIGRQCVPLLVKDGFEVHAVSTKRRHERQKGVQWHQADLLDPQKVLKLMAKVHPSHLLHFAWYAEPGKYWTSLKNLDWVKASVGLLQEFYSRRGKRAVMAGTCAEYDWNYGYCLEKTTPVRPATLYGACKSSVYNILDRFSAQTGLSYAWGRIFFLYGPHEYPGRLVPSVIRALLKKETALCSHGTQIRDFLYIQDAAEAFVSLLESDVQGAVNIASGQPVPLKEIIYKIAEKLGRRELVCLGGIPAARNEPSFLAGDVARLCTEVGWRPSTTLDEGLEAAIEWWKTSNDA